MKTKLLYLLVLLIFFSKANAANEDFETDYTEKDEAADISASTGTITVTSANSRGNYWAFYKDFGASYFGTSLHIQFVLNATVMNNIGHATAMVLSGPTLPTGTQEVYDLFGANDEFVKVYMYDASGTRTIRLLIVEDGSGTEDTSSTVSLSTDYYCDYVRSGQTHTLTIRTGSHTGTVFDTLVATETSYTTSYRMCWGVTSWDTGSGSTVSYTVKDMDLAVASSSPIVPKIMQYYRRRH